MDGLVAAVGNNLEANIIDTTDKAMIENWYLGSLYRVELFKTADDKVLLDSQVENLVQAMAAFAPRLADHLATHLSGHPCPGYRRHPAGFEVLGVRTTCSASQNLSVLTVTYSFQSR